MKKVVLAILIAVVLISSASALVKTRLYGEVNPNANVQLVITYTANYITYNNQLVRITTENYGDWEYKISSDEGSTIYLVVQSQGSEKAFETTSGVDLKANLFEKVEEESDNETANNETASITGAAIEEDLETETTEQGIEAETTETSEKAVSGLNLKGFHIFLIIIGMFLMLIAANLVSDVIIGGVKRVNRHRSEKSVKVVKLSEKLQKAKDRLEEARKQEQEVEQKLKAASGGVPGI